MSSKLSAAVTSDRSKFKAWPSRQVPSSEMTAGIVLPRQSYRELPQNRSDNVPEVRKGEV